MLFDLADKSHNDEDVDVEDPVFGSEAEFNDIMCLCLEAATTTKSQTLALFKRI
jgi:hypothetical protein